MKARRILYVDTGRSFGGAERITVALASAFVRAGAETACIVDPGATAFRKVLESVGVESRPVPEAYRLSRVSALTREIRRFAPDIVHIHRTWPLSDRYAALAARRAGARRVIATEHVRWERCGFRDRLTKRLLARYDSRIVAVSHAVRESLVGYWKLSPALVSVVENGIDTGAFRIRGPAGAGPFPETWTKRIGAIGRLEEQKGYDVLIDAMARVVREFPGAGLLVAGEGSLRSRLEAMVRERGLEERVLFAGAVDDVRPLLASLDVFVLASRWEGLPLTILEAMAAGAPIVATAAPGTLEAVRPGREGLVAPVGDASALAEAIAESLRDPEGARVRAEAARRRVEARYSVRRMVGEYETVYGS